MSENVLITTQKLIQDVIAPDLRELKVKVDAMERRLDTKIDTVEKRLDAKIDSLEHRMNARFDAVDARFDAVDARFDAVDARFDAVDARFKRLEQRIDEQFAAFKELMMASFAALKAENAVTTMREIGSIRERVAVLEARSSQPAALEAPAIEHQRAA